ncbi:MAG: Clp protease N-terminal domain-containing protein [Anaerolineae bacterium]
MIDLTRFSQEARLAFVGAQDEAARLRHADIRPAHLIAALLRDTAGLPAPLLQPYGVTADVLREDLDTDEKDKLGAKQGLAPALRDVMKMSVQIARRYDHRVVAPPHLLMAALLYEQPNPTAERLILLGVPLADMLEDLDARLQALDSEDVAAMSSPIPTVTFDDPEGPEPKSFAGFSNLARGVIELAMGEAERAGRGLVDTEDLLLTLMRHPRTRHIVQDMLLAAEGASVEDLAARIEARKAEKSPPQKHRYIGLTDDAAAVLDLALVRATNRRREVSPAHVRLALVQQGAERTGLAQQALLAEGVRLRRASRRLQPYIRQARRL